MPHGRIIDLDGCFLPSQHGLIQLCSRQKVAVVNVTLLLVGTVGLFGFIRANDPRYTSPHLVFHVKKSRDFGGSRTGNDGFARRQLYCWASCQADDPN